MVTEHAYTFLQQVDKLDHLFNWSSLELPSQGWAWEDAMSPMYVILAKISQTELLLPDSHHVVPLGSHYITQLTITYTIKVYLVILL